ncbi:MAG: PQQ-dependent sugar dehydrogenase [Dehalococcoidales bacterium]|nr:PQQ-dependent sugar dehydrogenase [Dehalococcoidales bacterium]
MLAKVLIALLMVVVTVFPACAGRPPSTMPTASPNASQNNTPMPTQNAAPAPNTTPTPNTSPSIPVPPATALPLSPIPDGSIKVERVFPDLSFREMTNLVQPDDASGLIFVTEQRGVIQAFASSQPQQGSYIFLDITDRVNRGGDEEGLLGIVFDPDYKRNGQFYVYYSAANPRRSVLSRFSLDQKNLKLADPQSEVIIMEIAQPFSNHNGGQLAFGPDGYLYIGLGDGGSAGDPQGNGQNLKSLLGKILRIDVRGLSGSGSYKIPADNPFINTTGARAEIWAFGLRNPWRFSFDTETGLLWAGDVGQNKWEEIDIISKGGNYGWNIMEGSHCYSPDTRCNQSGMTLPLVEYDHSKGCSVTGGYVYRGDNISSLKGYYIYGDYCSGNIWALGYEDNTVTQNILLADSGLSITSFGEDMEGNLYILSREGGIYTLVQKK